MALPFEMEGALKRLLQRTLSLNAIIARSLLGSTGLINKW
jgi:hypothetical protein